MKKVTILFWVVLIFGIFASAVFGQAPTRIKFKKGATSTVVTGSLSSYKSKRTFVIKVREGQTLTTENAGKYSITISVEAPPGSTYEQDMAADCHDRNEVTPTAAGDYKITVTECQKADPFKGTFKFKVVVR
ncbi:hypothetical protein BH10ACI3_BH10ACI3_06060 [soil metagenome]